MSFKNKEKGFSILGILVLGVILILVLSYFNVSIRGVVESPTGQDNISYVKGTSQSFWNKYLASPAEYLWNDVWLKIFWRPFISTMQSLVDGKSAIMDTFSTPQPNLKGSQ